jgi:hypothetical protein
MTFDKIEHEAAIALIRETPGAATLTDVQAITSRPWPDLLAEKVEGMRAHAYRIAQARRLIRLCGEVGVRDPEDLTPEAIASVCDENGKIKPEPQDYEKGSSQ